jgi:methyl-accepting chemotaxis protein
VASGKPLLTEPYIGAGTDYLVMTQAVPFKDAAGHTGALGVNLNLQTVAQMLNAVDLNGLGYAFLVSADGKVLVHPDKTWVTKNLNDLFPEGTPALTNALNEVEENGQPRLLSFTAIDGLPSVKWYVGLSIDPKQAFAAQHEFRLTALVASVIAVLLTLALLGLLIGYLLRPLHSMEQAMQSIAEGEGDLTQRLQVVSQDEFGVLASAFNRFVARIQQSITDVAHTCSQLNALAVRVNQASSSSMHSSDTQAGHTQSVATAINELGAAAHEIARSAAHASQRASGARQESEQGRQVVVRSIEAMDQLSHCIGSSRTSIELLNTKTASISRILDVIKGISDQTNLLALNAAIEAARAGEAGRGFAVVSDEVRSLAHRTQQSAAEIHSMIEELQNGAGAAVRAMAESQRLSDENVHLTQLAGERLSGVMVGIGEIDEINLSMATATEEQSSVVESLDRDITTITDLNQAVVANLQATLQACSELEQESQRLQQMVGSFRI